MSNNSYFSPRDIRETGTDGAGIKQPTTRPHHSAESRGPNWEPTPDLRSNCPICGRPYQLGDEVVVLASQTFGAAAVRESTPAAGSPVFLGHHDCVLPRLLTLLASFQPANRFE